MKKQREAINWWKWAPKVFQVVFATMNDILDAERTWQKFVNRVSGADHSERYLRINPELRSEPPRLDEKDKILSLEADTKISLYPTMHASIREAADRLIASCFYFEKSTVQPVDTQIAGNTSLLTLQIVADSFQI